MKQIFEVRRNHRSSGIDISKLDCIGRKTERESLSKKKLDEKNVAARGLGGVGHTVSVIKTTPGVTSITSVVPRDSGKKVNIGLLCHILLRALRGMRRALQGTVRNFQSR